MHSIVVILKLPALNKAFDCQELLQQDGFSSFEQDQDENDALSVFHGYGLKCWFGRSCRHHLSVSIGSFYLQL